MWKIVEAFARLIEQKKWIAVVTIAVIAVVAAFALGAGQIVTEIAYQELTSTPQRFLVDASPREPAGAGDSTRPSRLLTEQDWDFGRHIGKTKLGANGEPIYYCAKSRPGYQYVTFFSKPTIALEEQFSLSYSLRIDPEFTQRDEVNPEEMKVVFIYGNATNSLYSIFVPTKDRRFIGLEDKSSTAVQTHQSRPLPFEMIANEGEQISLVMKVRNPISNEAIISYNLQFFATVEDSLNGTREHRPVPAADHFKSLFPWPNPNALENLQHIGIGLYPGTCIQLFSPQIQSAMDGK